MAKSDCKIHTESYYSIIHSTSSLLESLRFINSLDFKLKITDTNKVYKISVKISSAIGKKLNDTSFAHCFDIKHPVLISFESIETKDIKIFWKLPGDEEFYFLELTQHNCDLVAEFCRSFLLEEIGKGRSGKIFI